ncbi:GNAT family N-acetyltransferase [Tateyamaria armeniaca]|uniref:GNAT family N-acetyltransferase n=1 Tax=Tateyamaria armeniaca TaxID=2518930 RepID=A0ABW8USE0_9RHOB
MSELLNPLFTPPELISSRHSLKAFDCGNEAMTSWLKTHALDNEGVVSRTYVIADAGNSVIAYYTLATGRIDRRDLPRRKRHNSPEFIPVIVLGRLAVDRNHSGLGLGSGMLREAMLRTLEVSKTIGVRALLVHAIDDDAVPYYQQYGFIPSPTSGRSLILPVETIKDAL